MSWGAALPVSGELDYVEGGRAGLEAKSIITLIVPAPSGCNLNCAFCYIKQRNEKAKVIDLLFRDYTKFILSVTVQKSIGAICIQGYEPLLPESFVYTSAVLATGKHLGIPTSFVTNGTHLRQHVPALSKLRPARIAVSLDSAEAAVHDKARGKVGAFDDTLAGLQYALNVPALKKALVVTSILMPKKRDRLTGMPKLLSELGIDRWVVNALVKVGKGDKLGGPAGERQAILDDLLVLKAEADRYGIDMVVDDEFGRLTDDDRAKKLMEVEALRIKRLVQPEGVYRLVPTGHCSKGIDILKPIHDNTPIWDPKTDAGAFLASMSD
ncbi:MAG: radical SAM protein [Geminicoccales bacterium]